MKKIILAAMALAALAACSKEATVDVAREEITFGNAFVDNSTKADAATDPSYSTTGTKGVALTQFNVYGAVNGVNIFDGDNVTKGSADYGAVWTHDGAKQYWVTGADYIFDAVVDATTVNTDPNTGLPLSLTYQIAGQKDMLHDRVVTVGAANHGLVEFTFPHLLSKVKLTVKNSSAADATNYRITITDIALSDIYSKGDYVVASGTWNNLQDNGTYAINDMVIASNSTEECAAEVLLIPDLDFGISFNVNVQIKKGSDWQTLTTTPFSKLDVGELEANHAYNLMAEYAIGGEIHFTAVEMSDWVTGSVDDLN